MASPTRILASDLDGTLIPPRHVDGAAGIARFRAAVEGRDHVLLAYVTGRDLAFAVAGIREAGLPAPHALACDVGTSVYHPVGGVYEPDHRYVEEMRRAMGGHTGDDARAVLAGVPELELQESSKQGPFKASAYFRYEDRAKVAERVGGALSAAGVRANVVISRDPDTGGGLLDALPPGVAKDFALRFLRATAPPPLEEVAFAGDSGNDRAALLSGYQAIVVGNARPELVAELEREAERLGLLQRVYFAQGLYADGVLEGCRHFGVL